MGRPPSPAARRIRRVCRTAPALYPHLTVFENIAFPLRLRHVADDEINSRVEEAASTLQLTDYLDRKPANLRSPQPNGIAQNSHFP